MNVTPLRERGRRHLEEAGEYQKKHVRAGNGPAESKLKPARLQPGLEFPLCGHKPGMQGAKIFQTSHRQMAQLGGRGLLASAGPYFLHKIRLNLRALGSQSGCVVQTQA